MADAIWQERTERVRAIQARARAAWPTACPACRTPDPVPAIGEDGWEWLCASEQGNPHDDPLVCWALVELPDGWREDRDNDCGEVFAYGGRDVVGLVAMDASLTPAPYSDNFIGYAAPSDPIDVFADDARAHRERVAQCKGAREARMLEA
jgi:hypothetical protein